MSVRHSNLHLEDIDYCPVFEPSLEEFKAFSFQDYLMECEKLIDPNCGVFKVVAPEGWIPRKEPYLDFTCRIDGK